MLKDLFANRTPPPPVLLTNREIVVLIGEAWPQTARLFKSVNQSSITLIRLSAKIIIFFSLFMLKYLSAKRWAPIFKFVSNITTEAMASET